MPDLKANMSTSHTQRITVSGQLAHTFVYALARTERVVAAWFSLAFCCARFPQLSSESWMAKRKGEDVPPYSSLSSMSMSIVNGSLGQGIHKSRKAISLVLWCSGLPRQTRIGGVLWPAAIVSILLLQWSDTRMCAELSKPKRSESLAVLVSMREVWTEAVYWLYSVPKQGYQIQGTHRFSITPAHMQAAWSY